ncbi:Yip1 domain protein (macronuclear) [Tetrahymena thermophila SB210]|uniref:Protein YIPF n=1 Tax=Tetrahymena thermophila (strain SB210) TaxID=312017 RepID=Q23C08_TETTS|nr:Yip1 domain protein [Tetrahymena thermophila SB210]EAR93960.3 Yip1 domain protein [Tetrahymena thermophila SB210]|eukprot:XP_001014205.3 Yip1 domain protein [Tetrahymena thermophila SB210]
MAQNPFAVKKKNQVAFKNPFGIKNPIQSGQTDGIYNPQDGGWGDTVQAEGVDDIQQFDSQNAFEVSQGIPNNGFSNTFQQPAKPAVPNPVNQKNIAKKNPFPQKPQNAGNPFAFNPNAQPKGQEDLQFDNSSSLDFQFNMVENTVTKQNSNQQGQQQPKRFDPNQAQQQQQQYQQQQYQQQLGYSNLGFDPNNVDPDNEPPLLVELGVDLNSIKIRTLSVLKFQKCDIQFLEDPDMSGPIILGFIFGFLLLLSGKMQFGYVYGFGISGTLAIYCIMNFLSMHREIPLYNTLSILGYCLMPVIILSFFNVFISLRFSIGYVFALLSILWSTYAATNFFNELIHQEHQKYLVAYPVFLFYSIFVLLTIF